MKILFLVADSNSCYPVPATKDGAVTTLIERLIKINENQRSADFEVISFYDEDAVSVAKAEYSKTKFKWIKIPKVISICDDLFYNIVRIFFKGKKLISYRKTFSLLWYVFKSSIYLRRHKYDKVVLENNMVLSWIIRLSGYNGEIYYHLHNIPRTCVKNKKIFEQCSRYLCVSDFVGLQIEKSSNPIGPVDSNKIKTVYNCIDTNQFKMNDCIERESILSKYGVHTDERVILFVGRISEEKGIIELLKATEHIMTRNYKILIVGSYIHYDKKSRDVYSNTVYEYAEKIKDKVVFTGYINQLSISDLYNVADVAVLPSMWEEPAGLTMIEAMACGLHVITTRSGGIPEYVGNCAVVLERNEALPKNIAYHIDDILTNKNNKNFEGKKRVNELFSETHYLEDFINSLER